MKNIENKIRIGLFLLLLIPSIGISQTYVSGIISSNTTWFLNGSPYIVQGNILLSEGIVLTIEPGVQVKVDNNCGLQIKVTLIARGNSSNRITFDLNCTTPSNGAWSYIYFTDYSADAILSSNGTYVSGCVLEYCDIMNSGALGYGAIYSDIAMPLIRNCNITNSHSYGIYGFHCGFRIENCNISNNSGSGLHFKWQITDLRIYNNTINNNLEGGITFEPSANPDSIIITGNEINDNLINGGIYIPTQLGSKRVLIQNNTIKNNKGSIGAGIHLSGGYITIKCNSIINNEASSRAGGIYITYSDEPNTYKINNNYFRENTSDESFAIEIASTYNTYTCPVYINNNIFIQNRPLANYGTVLLLSGRYTTITFSINNNLFIENSGYSSIKVTNFVGSIYSNNFINNNVTYDLINGNDIGHNEVDAMNNYWGTIEESVIGNHIIDWTDNSSLSVVNYLPILNTPNSSILNVSNLDCSQIDTLSIINEVNNNLTFIEVFPNPSDGILNFRNIKEESTVEIYNITGQLIYKTFIEDSNQTIDLSGKEKGLYFIRIVSSKNEMSQGRIIIQ